jgi:hypothetical protein
MRKLKKFLFWIPDSLEMPPYLRWWIYGSPPVIGFKLGYQIWAFTETVNTLQIFCLAADIYWLSVYGVIFCSLRHIIAEERAMERWRTSA